MNAKIFSFIKVTRDSMIASNRIARFTSNTLGLPIIWDEAIADEPLDILVIINGAYAFAGKSLLAALGTAIEQASRIIWIQNDYTIEPPKDEGSAESPFRKAFVTRRGAGKTPVDFWTTVQRMSSPGRSLKRVIGDDSMYVNWNALTFDEDPGFLELFPGTNNPYGSSVLDHLIYYGSHRADRVKYFDRYFANPRVPTTISCPNKKFHHYIDPLIRHRDRIGDSIYHYLRDFGLGLYLEDTKSHGEFHSPANRLYEMLSAGLPIGFQPESIRMMEKAGYVVDDFVMWNAISVPEFMSHRDEIRTKQREMWWEKAKSEHDSLAPLIIKQWEKYS